MARRASLGRELIIEGFSSIQEGVSPRLIEQHLRGFLLLAREAERGKRVA
jgi:hypothetical protein